ncbi:MAG: hypothetical protein AAGF84_00450 [Planctomycetota bacterium]
MKTMLLIVLGVTLLAVGLWWASRRSTTAARDLSPHETLRRHIEEDRPYRYFLGVPMQQPTRWVEADTDNHELLVDGDPIPLNEIRSFLVVYANGEVLTARNEFYPLPGDVHFVDIVESPKLDVLNPDDLQHGNQFVAISFAPSLSQPNNPDHYSTAIQNIGDVPIRVARFVAFTRAGNQFQLSTISGDYFTSGQFVNWYGAPEDGWIPAGEYVEDPNNYGGGDGYWVYEFEIKSGGQLVAGGRIPSRN